MRRPGEEGVALLTVLLLVAVMSVLAVGLLDDIRFGLRRSANAQAVGQARWYAIGAEALARARITRLADADALRSGDWNGRAFQFPIEGGMIQARVRDATACFNLNSVVEGAGELYRRRDQGVSQFKTLMTTLDVAPREAETLAGALVDWIDSDQLRESGGAEDEAYARGARPYRTSGALLSEVSELRAVQGFGAEVYGRLRPHVCALPTADLSPINLNGLRAQDAVLLTMLTDGALPPDLARRIIGQKPAGGWTSAPEFWAAVRLHADILDDQVINQVAVTPRFFTLQTEVAYLDADVVATALLERAAGQMRLVARRWTPDE